MSSSIHTSANTNPLTGFLIQLKSRNKLLYYFGLLNTTGAFVCLLLTGITTTEVLGINAFIKPLKFFVSIVILSFTMGWYMIYLKKQKAVTIYSWVLVLVMTFEMTVVVWQAANGRLSHFNTSTPLYILLFNLMGVAIVIFTLWTLYIGILFFVQKDFPPLLPQGYIWGIRFGILLFVIFAFEGGHMAARLAHTVGAPDGGEGLPLVNWSKHYGDLRIAHFFGMHSLQILPLAGISLTKTKTQILLLSMAWLLFVIILYRQALAGVPLLG